MPSPTDDDGLRQQPRQPRDGAEEGRLGRGVGVEEDEHVGPGRASAGVAGGGRPEAPVLLRHKATPSGTLGGGSLPSSVTTTSTASAG